MLYRVTREEIERIIKNQEDIILSKYTTLENIIKLFSNLDIFKSNNPNIVIDYFYPKTCINGKEKMGVKYIDEKQKEHYMFFEKELAKKKQVKRIMVGRKVGAHFYLIWEEFSDNSLKNITIIVVLIRDIAKRKKDKKLRIRFRQKFDLGKDNYSSDITELSIMIMQEITKSIKAFNKLFKESKLT